MESKTKFGLRKSSPELPLITLIAMLLDPAINVPKDRIEEFMGIISEDLLRLLTGRDGEVILDCIK